MSNIAFFITPASMLIIILYAFIKKVNIFDEFLKGASEGIKITFSLAPTLIGLIVSVSMLKASGALDILSNFSNKLLSNFNVPCEIIPLALIKPISGSGSIAILDNILKNYGPDSFIGMCASVMMASSETTFYILAVYFGSSKIKKSRHVTFCAIATTVFALATSVIVVKIFLK